MIRFTKYWFIYLLISVTVMGVGLFSIIKYGYKYSIDFTGGTEVVYRLEKSKEKVTKDVVSDLVKAQSAEFISFESRGEDIIIRSVGLNEKKEKILRSELSKDLGSPLILLKYDEVGPTVASDMIQKTLIAVAIAVLIILAYIFYAFKKVTFAISAVLAMLHDVLVVLGMYSLMSHFLGAQLDTLFVTGILTTMSFSVHDTIVIFDKIRESRKNMGVASLSEVADKAVSSTIIRSLNNSLTILFMLVALVVLGGESIKFFAMTLLVGTITGAYSSPFVATPIMLWLEKWGAKATV